jgi:phytoene dehydrogenase-like protein
MSKISRREFVRNAALAPLAASSFSFPRQIAPTNQFEIVIAGAGHNSMITAAYLAKAGYRCLLLEGRPIVGGGVKTAELTLRGFKDDVCSSVHSFIQDNPLLKNDELHLKDYGLEYIHPDPIMHMPFPDGTYLTQWHDPEKTFAEFAKFSKNDAQMFQRMTKESEVIKPLADAVNFTPIGFGKPMNELLAGIPRGKLWQRRMAMSAWEIIRDNFEDDHCRAFLLAMGHLSTIPPEQPVTGRLAYSAASSQLSDRPIPKGGSGALTQALAQFFEAHGGVILTNKWIKQLIIENGRCAGVECSDDSAYHAEKAVVSTIHIKHLVDMAPKELWGEEFLEGVKTFEPECTMFVSHYATTEPPKYPVAGGGTLSPTESLILATPVRGLRFAYDDALGAVNLNDPPLQVICCTVADPTRAPHGMHTVKIIGFQPYSLKEGPEHWNAIKKSVSEANMNHLRRFAPNLTEDKILARFIESPLDLERMNPAFWRGSAHGGAMTPAQSGPMRPVPGWAQYRMPIPGLYQTGATTHPGGSVTGAPGRNAAMVMLKDFGTSIEAVVAKKG